MATLSASEPDLDDSDSGRSPRGDDQMGRERKVLHVRGETRCLSRQGQRSATGTRDRGARRFARNVERRGIRPKERQRWTGSRNGRLPAMRGFSKPSCGLGRMVRRPPRSTYAFTSWNSCCRNTEPSCRNAQAEGRRSTFLRTSMLGLRNSSGRLPTPAMGAGSRARIPAQSRGEAVRLPRSPIPDRATRSPTGGWNAGRIFSSLS